MGAQTDSETIHTTYKIYSENMQFISHVLSCLTTFLLNRDEKQQTNRLNLPCNFNARVAAEAPQQPTFFFLR